MKPRVLFSDGHIRVVRGKRFFFAEQASGKDKIGHTSGATVTAKSQKRDFWIALGNWRWSRPRRSRHPRIGKRSIVVIAARLVTVWSDTPAPLLTASYSGHLRLAKAVRP